MSNHSGAVSAAIAFIDMASFAEVDGYLYGGAQAVTKFVLSIVKANWYSFVPILLRWNGSSPEFGSKNVVACINRSGDYVLNMWFRTRIPQIQLVQPAGAGIFLDSSIRWTKNLMHNLFETITITFNELVVQELDNYSMDFNYQFRLPGAKRIGYKNMIGEIASMTTPVGPAGADPLVNPAGILGTGGYFSCPLNFWFCEDSGVALPVAALPFNDIKANYVLRRWQDLLIIYPGTLGVGGPLGTNTGTVATTSHVRQVEDDSKSPELIDPQTLAHYAVVHNDERVVMGSAPRDILISQNQLARVTPFKDVSSRTSFDLRFSHAIKCLMWVAQNVTLINRGGGGGEWSNYTSEIGYTGLDPMAFSTLTYENSVRFANESDYFSLIQPFFFSKAIPDETGYHMYTYALKPWACNGASGSTNYSKLANVAISHGMSKAGIQASLSGANGNPLYTTGGIIQYPNSQGELEDLPQKFQHVLHGFNHNIIRIANGSLGHPVL
jgi:hypothetical protein